MPFFSVVIPTYNRADKLKGTISSVLDQSFTDFEVLVMDDGSTDNTDAVVKSFNDLRINYEWYDNSGGPAAPRNRGIRKAKSEWICFLDADDAWYRDKLQICYNNIDDTVDLIYHDLNIQTKTKLNGRNVLRSGLLKSPVLVNLMINGNIISNSSVVVRTNILKQVGNINESHVMVAAEDYNTWLKIAEVTEKFLYIPKVLGEYVFSEDAISRKDMSICGNYAIDDFKKHLNDTQLGKCMSLNNYTHGKYLYSNKMYKPALNSLVSNINKCPLEYKFKSSYLIVIIYIRMLLSYFFK
jgi:glycosyltransferase involved in cell wall biosynthesis